MAAGLIAGGVPAHEVEDDVRAVAARLGHGDAQVGAAPTSVRLALSHGAPAPIEGGLRLGAGPVPYAATTDHSTAIARRQPLTPRNK